MDNVLQWEHNFIRSYLYVCVCAHTCTPQMKLDKTYFWCPGLTHAVLALKLGTVFLQSLPNFLLLLCTKQCWKARSPLKSTKCVNIKSLQDLPLEWPDPKTCINLKLKKYKNKINKKGSCHWKLPQNWRDKNTYYKIHDIGKLYNDTSTTTNMVCKNCTRKMICKLSIWLSSLLHHWPHYHTGSNNLVDLPLFSSTRLQWPHTGR
jgi:hypothetical protein